MVTMATPSVAFKGRGIVDTFNESTWARKDFSENYLEKADIYIPERRKMIRVVSSLHSYFFAGKKDVLVLDLGCGDGVLTEELLKQGGSILPLLIDGSESMLQKARERLRAYQHISYRKASFHELLNGPEVLGKFDFCISSHAIHHLEMHEKAELFNFIAGHLNRGGRFINADVVLPPSEELEAWYFALWKDWMQHMMDQLGIMDETPDDVIRRYKDPASLNKPDTLDVQFAALKKAGFQEVDCYHKNGIFAVFGGKL
jgi:tRNA (cmo5U34)-methyltransferase